MDGSLPSLVFVNRLQETPSSELSIYGHGKAGDVQRFLNLVSELKYASTKIYASNRLTTLKKANFSFKKYSKSGLTYKSFIN